MPYLYRGLRKVEVEAGYKLIPKGAQTFENMNMVHANASGTYDLQEYGPLVATANHLNGLPTSGVSTTANFETAKRYSMSGPEPTGIVVRIDRSWLAKYDITEHWVNQIFPSVDWIDREEVILENKLGSFLREIIDQVYDVSKTQ